MKMGDWLASEAQTIRQGGEPDRLRLLECYAQAYRARETNPDLAVGCFDEGRQLATKLGEPWWALFYAKERVDALLHFKRDYRRVLDLAVQTVVEVRKPQNAMYPGRLGIWDSLLAAYLGIDPEGYAGEIQQALDYLEREVPPEPDGARYLLLARKRIFHRECGRLAEAYDTSMEELNLGAADPDKSRAIHFGVFTYCELCQIAAAIQQFQTVGEWATTAAEFARHVGHQCELSEALAWQAVAALQAGETDRARRTYQTATTTAGRLLMPPKQGYYNALALYHQKHGDWDRVLSVHEAELETVADRGRLLLECRVRIKCCALLARLNRLQPAAVKAAREAAGKLRQPDKYLQEIDQLGA
jgi:hypothetical protein